MDRSFLSLTPVVRASRRYVCIRPLSYENAEEARYLRSLFVGGAGEVENTTFCVLSSDGKRLLTRPTRGIQQLFRNADSMAEWMNQTADALIAADALAATDGSSRKKAAGPAPLPVVPTVRHAINVAAADNHPLVVLRARGPKERAQAEKVLAELAVKEEFIGRFTFGVSSGAAELASVAGAGSAPGVLVVQPDRFGQQGSVITRAPETASAKQLAAVLRDGLQRFQPNPVTGFEHVREGQRQGVFWETLLPVTDPMEAQARERTRWFARPAPPPAPQKR